MTWKNLILLAFGLLVVAGACSSDADDPAQPSADTSSPPDEASRVDSSAEAEGEGSEGIVSIRFESIGDGVFIEGFLAGFRFESSSGEVIASTSWSDFISSLPGEPGPRAAYESELEQPVTTGEVVVLATVNIGAGPPPDVPDIDGEMDCRLEVEVPAGGRVDVEVLFDGSPGCLRVI